MITTAVIWPPGTAQRPGGRHRPVRSGGNPVTCENSKPGTPASEWDIGYTGDSRCWASPRRPASSRDRTVAFKIKATAAYTVDIYRLGYYGGDGARRQASDVDRLQPGQPARLRHRPQHVQLRLRHVVGLDPVAGARSSAVSGVYIAKLTSGARLQRDPVRRA